MKKLSIEQMEAKIAEKKYYITHYTSEKGKANEWELSHDTKEGYSGGVVITDNRASEWIKAGAEVLEM